MTDLSGVSNADLLKMYTQQQAAAQGVDPTLATNVMLAESQGNPNARSPKGAIGPMQLEPATAAQLGVDPNNPGQNIQGGVRYLKQQVDRFGDPRLAAAAYNAGPGAVEKYGGVPPYAETQNYVQKTVPTNLSSMSNAQLQALYQQQQRAAPKRQSQQQANRALLNDPMFLATGIPSNMRVVPQASPGEQRAMADLRARQKNSLSGQDNGAGTQFWQGYFLNFGDELAGAMNAADTLVDNAGRKITGQPIPYTSADAYNAGRTAFLQDAQGFQQKHPVGSLALGLSGGALTPGASLAGKYIAEAPSFGRAVLRSAQVGAAFGGLAGAGAGNGLAGRAKSAATGAAVGGAVGGAIPGAVKVAQSIPALTTRIVAGSSEAGSRVAQMAGATPKAATITPGATQRAETLVRDMATGRGITADAAAADPAMVAGKPITGAELLGRQAQTQLGALARRTGGTGDAVAAHIASRIETAPARVVDDFASATGIDPSTVADDFSAMTAALRDKAAPLYQKAYDFGGLDSAALRDLTQRPSIQAAMQRATRIAQEEGRDPTELGFELQKVGETPTTTELVHTERVPGGGTRDVRVTVPGAPNPVYGMVKLNNPTAQTWDYVKRGVDDILEGYRNPLTRRLQLDEQGRAIVGTHGQLRNELVAQNPAYGEALNAGGEPLRLEQAWRDAPGLVSNRVSERIFRQRFDGLGDAERQAFLGGFANDLMEQARAGRLRLKAFNTPAFRSKLTYMVGPNKAGQFIDSLAQEARLAAGNRMAPGTNSVTPEIIQANHELDGKTGILADFQRRLEGGQNPISATVGTAVNAATSPIAGFVRGVQAPYGQAVRDELGRILLDPEATIAAIRNVPPRKVYMPGILANTVPSVAGVTSGILARQ